MAYGNDVIDLLGLAGDIYLSGGSLNGTTLDLTLNDGSVVSVDLSALVSDDDFVDSGTYFPGTQELVLTRILGGTVAIDLSAVGTDTFVMRGDVVGTDLILYLGDGVTESSNVVVDITALATDTFVNSVVLDAITGILTISMNDTPITTYTVDLGTYMSMNDIHVSNATYNCATDQIELRFTDATVPMVPIDMTCFVAAMVALEKGGIAWDGTKTYAIGDMVTIGTDAYIAIVPSAGINPVGNPGVWALAGGATSTEVGGVSYNPANTYAIGDVVTEGTIPYVSMNGTNSLPSTDPANWRPLSAVKEVGGKEHIISNAYVMGDIVHSGSKVWISAMNAPTAVPGVVVGEWTEFISIEFGGKLYDPNHNYVPGDVSVENNKTYSCLAPTTGPFNILFWKLVVDDEIGGRLWNVTASYKKGDTVGHPSNSLVYLALQASVGTDPLGGPPNWLDLKSERWIAGTFTPTAGNEYPAAIVGTTLPGAVWYTVGIDPLVGYTIVAGALAGYTYYDNDKYVYQGDDGTGNAIWLYEPFPRVRAELGGVAFSSTYDYLVGDFVYDGTTDDYYKAINNVAASLNVPSSDPANWELRITDGSVDLTYDPTEQYEAGEIVVGPAPDYDLFIVPDATTIPPGTVPPAAPWFNATLDEYRGREWSGTKPYEIGDMVTTGEKIYICILANTGDVPLAAPASWFYANSASLERGGIWWNSTVAYKIGDMVTQADSAYIALTDNLNMDPGVSPAAWLLANKPERGGVMWRAGEEYNVGDIVVDSTDGNIYTALTINAGVQPSLPTSAGDWRLQTSSFVYDPSLVYEDGDIVIGPDNELYHVPIGMGPIGPGVQPPAASWYSATLGKGMLWDATVQYFIGDVASENGNSYVALTNNLSTLPSVNPADWKATGSMATFIYDPAVVYPPGSIVVDPATGDMWIAPVGGVGPGVPPGTPPWVDAELLDFVNVTGDTMTGPLVLDVVPAAVGNEAISKQQSDTDYVNVTGDIMTGALEIPDHADVAGNKAINVDYLNAILDPTTGRIGDDFVAIAGDTMTGTLVSPQITLQANAGAGTDAVRAQSYGTATLGGTAKYTWDATNKVLNIITA